MPDIVKTGGARRPSFTGGTTASSTGFATIRSTSSPRAVAGSAFASEEAKQIFWGYLEKLAKENHFTLIIVSLLSNHYHILGYAKSGEGVKRMMQRLHGAVAKLVNDLLDERLVPFWSDGASGKKTYFDGCIRDELQCRRTYRYVLTQCSRHHICRDPKDYPNTRVYADIDRVVQRALELKAFLFNVPYARYERKRYRR